MRMASRHVQTDYVLGRQGHVQRARVGIPVLAPVAVGLSQLEQVEIPVRQGREPALVPLAL